MDTTKTEPNSTPNTNNKRSIAEIRADIDSLSDMPIPHHWAVMQPLFARRLQLFDELVAAFIDQIEEYEGVVTLPVQGCVHCGKDHDVRFRRFKATNIGIDNYLYKWWGMCPANNEPILMKTIEGK